MSRRFALLALIFAVLLPFAGCGGGDDDALTPADLAGTYNLTEVKATNSAGVSVTLTPPSVYGTLNLTAASTFTVTFSIPSESYYGTGNGSYIVNDPNITFLFAGGGTSSAVIRDGGRRIEVTEVESGLTYVFTFVRI